MNSKEQGNIKMLILGWILPLAMTSVLFFSATWKVEYKSIYEPYEVLEAQLTGFPFPYRANDMIGADWHGNSGEHPFSTLFFILNFVLYVMFWGVIVFFVRRFDIKNQGFSRIISRILLFLIIVGGCFSSFAFFIMWAYRLDWHFKDYLVLEFHFF